MSNRSVRRSPRRPAADTTERKFDKSPLRYSASAQEIENNNHNSNNSSSNSSSNGRKSTLSLDNSKLNSPRTPNRLGVSLSTPRRSPRLRYATPNRLNTPRTGMTPGALPDDDPLAVFDGGFFMFDDFMNGDDPSMIENLMNMPADVTPHNNNNNNNHHHHSNSNINLNNSNNNNNNNLNHVNNPFFTSPSVTRLYDEQFLQDLGGSSLSPFLSGKLASPHLDFGRGTGLTPNKNLLRSPQLSFASPQRILRSNSPSPGRRMAPRLEAFAKGNMNLTVTKRNILMPSSNEQSVRASPRKKNNSNRRVSTPLPQSSSNSHGSEMPLPLSSSSSSSAASAAAAAAAAAAASLGLEQINHNHSLSDSISANDGTLDGLGEEGTPGGPDSPSKRSRLSTDGSECEDKKGTGPRRGEYRCGKCGFFPKKAKHNCAAEKMKRERGEPPPPKLASLHAYNVTTGTTFNLSGSLLPSGSHITPTLTASNNGRSASLHTTSLFGSIGMKNRSAYASGGSSHLGSVSSSLNNNHSHKNNNNNNSNSNSSSKSGGITLSLGSW